MNLIDKRRVRAVALGASTLGLTLLSAWAAGSSQGAAFIDPLDTPARMSPRAMTAPITAVTRIDSSHLAAVGLRGHALLSADNGQTWTQSAVPLSSDLLAVQFPTPTEGWAVGHDGVLLRSADAGASWTKALDGRGAAELMVSHYEALAQQGNESAARLLEDAKRMREDGPTHPFMSVYFRDAREGWIVGQFNLILHTQDGGKSWQPWLDRTDNPDNYSLHSIRAVGEDVFIAGELGLLLKLDRQAQRFARITTPYPGSWFAAVGRPGSLILVGLQGNAWRSVDAGASWQRLQTGTSAAINGGSYLPDGRLVLVTQQGSVLLSADNGDTFNRLDRISGLSSGYDVTALDARTLLVAGSRGLLRVRLP